jgi:antitoxin component YwqK of YwqJK toxin-antitoxin module
MLSDILEYVFNDYVDHQSRDMNNLNKFLIGFRLKRDKYYRKETIEYKSGKICTRKIYIDGLLAKDEGWYDNQRNSKQFEKNCKYGLFHGRNFQANIFGQVTFDLNYKNGFKEGKQQYIESGNILKNNYKNGLKNGEELIFDLDSKLLLKNNYIDDKKEGIQCEYYTNKKIRIEHNYINGKKEGEQINYNGNGYIHEKYMYQNGNKVSRTLYKYFDESSRSKNNEISFIYNYNSNDDYHGKQYEFHRNSSGKVRIELNYINGKKEGEQLEYDINGNLIRIVIFKNGKKIE